ncbi:hypothetical protein DFJ74DRAFT_664109 [Hyaloraphidium curvatum]|nr:hypothetical protein DFJ74DRAFT_664109 [Hyaloraphidium curvatum]
MRGLVAVLQLWTLAVTFGGRSWTTPWTAFVMCLAVAAWVPTAAAVTFSVGALVDMPPGIRASGKLQCRAMKLVLVDLLARYRAALLPERGEPLDGEAEENKDDKPAPSMGCDAAHDLDGATEGEDYYVTLHSYLRGIWRGKLMFSLQRAILTSYGTAICISLVLNAAAGSCIPLWILVFLLSTLIGVFADLLRLADHNAQPELVSSLLRDAALEARSILLRAPPGPLPDRLARHATVLSSLADPQAHHRGTFLGIVVGYGVVRAVFATTATLLLAAWTVARAFGLVVVLDALCPGPG